MKWFFKFFTIYQYCLSLCSDINGNGQQKFRLDLKKVFV